MKTPEMFSQEWYDWVDKRMRLRRAFAEKRGWTDPTNFGRMCFWHKHWWNRKHNGDIKIRWEVCWRERDENGRVWTLPIKGNCATEYEVIQLCDSHVDEWRCHEFMKTYNPPPDYEWPSISDCYPDPWEDDYAYIANED